MTRLEIARYDRFALATMRELHRDGLPLVIGADDTVRAACSRFARGSAKVDWAVWRAATWGDRALALHHQRAVLAWLSFKAWLIWLDQAVAAPIQRLADRVDAYNAALSTPTDKEADNG